VVLGSTSFEFPGPSVESSQHRLMQRGRSGVGPGVLVQVHIWAFLRRTCASWTASMALWAEVNFLSRNASAMGPCARGPPAQRCFLMKVHGDSMKPQSWWVSLWIRPCNQTFIQLPLWLVLDRNEQRARVHSPLNSSLQPDQTHVRLACVCALRR